ncbi:MAG: hypothetical protein EXR29_14905 [Betaproteobacteria bacterium]|nr:hypothetical protein [Betaproteobacteria bacterium]
MRRTGGEIQADPLSVDAKRIPPDLCRPNLCPLCGGDNRCAMELSPSRSPNIGECWCKSADFGNALLARVPEAARGKACICARCAGFSGG